MYRKLLHLDRSINKVGDYLAFRSVGTDNALRQVPSDLPRVR